MKLGNFNIQNLSTNELMLEIDRRIDEHEQAILFFANTNFVVKCQHLVSEINSAPTLIVNDGIGIELANKIINRKGFKQNLNGTDFVPKLLETTKNKKVVLLGSYHEDLCVTSHKIQAEYGHIVTAQYDGYNDLKDPSLISKINENDPDILLVGLGNPKQEEWILKHFSQLNTPLIIGVGALFKFMSGNVKRAPVWMRRRRMEWLHRFCTEPTRLFMRYTFDIFKFFKICFKSK